MTPWRIPETDHGTYAVHCEPSRQSHQPFMGCGQFSGCNWMVRHSKDCLYLALWMVGQFRWAGWVLVLVLAWMILDDYPTSGSSKQVAADSLAWRAGPPAAGLTHKCLSLLDASLVCIMFPPPGLSVVLGKASTHSNNEHLIFGRLGRPLYWHRTFISSPRGTQRGSFLV